MSELPEVSDMFSCGPCSKLPCVCATPPMTRKQVEIIANKIRNAYTWKHEVNYWLDTDAALRQALAQQAQEIERLKADNRTYINERHEMLKQVEGLTAQLAAMTAERDEWEIKCRDKWDANTLLRRELAKLQGRFNSEVEASIRLEQRLAEAQGRVAEVGELNIKLRDAERQVEQLREACEPLVAIYAEESTATDSPYFDGPILTKAQVRAIQHALREPEGGPKYAKEMDHE